MRPKPTPKSPRSTAPQTLGLIVAFFGLSCSTAMLVFVLVSGLVETLKIPIIKDIPLISSVASTIQTVINRSPFQPAPQVAAAKPDSSAAAAPKPPADQPTPQPWDGKNRVTILVMGLDARKWEANDVPRSDSMWVVTVDPVAKTAGMMSIPRDTWAPIPGYDYGKINMAYFYGEAYREPGGGPALAVKTVQNFLKIHIDYYAVVDFNAFVGFIDKLDGIWIDIPEKITVDPLGEGNTVVLQPGRQRLDGAEALAYARNRYTAEGDFDRMQRQSRVIMAVRDRVTDPLYLPKLIGAAPKLYSMFGSGVRTDLKLNDAIRLAWLAEQIPADKIQKAVIGPQDMYPSWSPQGWSIEVPVMDRVMAIRNQVFSSKSQ